MAKRPTVKKFRKKALEKPGVKAEYDALSPAFEMKRQMDDRPPQKSRPHAGRNG